MISRVRGEQWGRDEIYPDQSLQPMVFRATRAHEEKVLEGRNGLGTGPHGHPTSIRDHHLWADFMGYWDTIVICIYIYISWVIIV